ncbi:MAG: hypothetical protein IIB03_10855, partial [Acidobacteria bacterium]|nr:hypothetical protein [Acidobacteriota bacterium]
MRTKRKQLILALVFGSLLFSSTSPPALGQETAPFRLVEATIGDIHNAIRTEQITCQELTQLYINRAKAYNGVCTQLVTEDGAPVPSATGIVSAGTPLEFPTETV